jgi:xylulokinase
MLIGIDVGTTAVKAALFGENGAVLKRFTERYPTHRPAPGHAEQDAEDWLRLVIAALANLGDGLRPDAIAAIGLCSQVNTHIFADADGNPLAPAMTWQDGRCAAEAAALDAQVTAEEKLSWWGAPLPIDASHVLARMAFMARHHREIWAKARWVLAPKDFCLLRLTGKTATDPMTAFGLVDSKLKLVQRLLELVTGSAERLPPLAPFTHVVGTIRDGFPCAGVPMVTGAMDAWSGLFGAGVSREGDALYLSGTSEILGIVSKKKAPTPGVIAFPECEGIVLHAGPTQSGGASIEWLSRLLAKSPAELSRLAAGASARYPLFLPHLEGERAPLWDITSRGAFAGLTSSMAAPELARAVFEGVAYSARLLLESLEASACHRPDIINHSGGGSASDPWCQIRADVLGRPIRRTAMKDAGVLGAAMMAGVGAGLFPSLHEAAKSLVATDRIFEPDAREHERHEARFARYRQLYQQLAPLHAALA